ncbi:hypothetical protein GCM10027275_44840 [Rhabdobacter roseus]|uniref:Lipoprotein n=1 Tax=Rhabdobacter roseus TaxID=1655419 RepID=A0A840TRA3_9BACT|nr:hypothetical protein [Rhabdobacter roseus]MBB5286846.1 hypothetical protein [Rhabdobacter roseus]
MKNTVLALLGIALTSLSTSCLTSPEVDPQIAICPPPVEILSQDTITTGSYRGMGINETAERVYTAIQALQQTEGLPYLNVVSNATSELTQLQGRLPLYQYILLDENQGTDAGVQLTLEAGVVTSIYLNSGQKLSQWPAKADASVRLGDRAEDLYGKLVKVRAQKQYASKFERIFLITKDLAKAYDPAMAQSPQWYFAFKTAADQMEEIRVYWEAGQLRSIVVSRLKLP